MDINVKNDTGDKSLIFDINDISNDDIMGISLLADPNKSKENSDDGQSTNQTTNQQTNSYVKEDYNLFDEVSKQPNTTPEQSEKKIDLNVSSKNDINDSLFSNKIEQDTGFKSIQTMNSQDIKNEKIDLLYKFRKLENQGVKTTMNYNMNSHLDDMRNEYLKLKKQREVENSIKFQRKVMMATITGVEFLNNKFDPFSVHLDGWSESVNENIYDYDEVFEELYEKYGGGGEMAPEIKLLLMLGGSGFMFHLSKTMFNTGLPGMGDIMKDNPDLMKKFAKAAMGNAMGIDPTQNSKNKRPEMNGPPNDIDEIISDMNLQPNNIDLDNISIISDGSIKLDLND